MYKKEMNYNEVFWNFSGFTKVLKIYIGLYKVQIDI